MFKHWMEIVHNHDSDYLDWLFHWNIFPERVNFQKDDQEQSDLGHGGNC